MPRLVFHGGSPPSFAPCHCCNTLFSLKKKIFFSLGFGPLGLFPPLPARFLLLSPALARWATACPRLCWPAPAPSSLSLFSSLPGPLRARLLSLSAINRRR